MIGSDVLVCGGCRRQYPIRDGILHATNSPEGSNRIAADFYNGPRWDRVRFWERMALFLAGGEARVRARFLEPVIPLKGKRVLEVAIGDGCNISYMGEGCEVYGVDLSEVQLRRCRRNHPEKGLFLFLSEAERLPLQNDYFDHAITVGAFNLFRDRRAALQEMARVVRRGGVIVIVDEVPSLVKRLPGKHVGLPGFDRWVLSRILFLGEEFASLLEEHGDLDVKAEAEEFLTDVRVSHLVGGACYRLVGTVL